MSSLKKPILFALSNIMNVYLRQDPDSARRLKALENKTLAMSVDPMHFHFLLRFDESGIQAEPGEAQSKADVYLRGTALQFSAMMLTKKNRQQFFEKDIHLEGDPQVAAAFAALFDEANIDWEELLSRCTGDVAAFHLNQSAIKIWECFTHIDKRFSQEINEFFHEEIKCFPPREALADFCSDVDLLRADLDRLTLRIARCESNLSEHKESQ